MTPARFRTLVFAYYDAHGRHTLPWRKTHDPYKILVSEIMLQQTQVDRVIPFYTAFLKSFPTPKRLAEASLTEVLRHWQGLGYNRRAKMLFEAAKVITKQYQGTVPTDVPTLESLPGIGPYTARAVVAFAANQDVIFVETNLRTAVTYHFFPNEEKVSDTAVLEILAKAYPKGNARQWYAALMDYGAHLKRLGIRINAKSAGYTKQRTFRGSGREARGALLKALLKGTQKESYLLGILGDDRIPQVRTMLENLVREGMVLKKGTTYILP